ncbi:unnamed protein product [Eruca vesicaria subsp. sativa]|uniref:AB hydrolase-1 domain-containing protein n=1 Tax=Eruca vesicaria subsp. sativa TaxID=29727 RepID=A0ABC8JYD2_ERUVS|nr:unnamed protein product [Eruca vesicaria subsp. sativa]
MSRDISAALVNEQRRSSCNGVVKTFLLVSLAVLFTACFYQSIQPPPVKTFSVTSPRVKLRDGRHLAYKEHGVSRDIARYKIVYIHGFDSCRHDAYFSNSISQGLVEELMIYSVSFDRPGYGESDPDPNRTPRSIALDIEQLADGLGLGPKFYVLGFSLGGQITWSCLHYIPHRLAGVTLVAPVINFWWRNLPVNMSKEALSALLPRDRWALRVAHYMPWLTYWWNTQRWFPVFSIISGNREILCPQDMTILSKLGFKRPNQAHTRQQGEYESLHRDLIVGFGNWEFDPLDVQNPFPDNEGLVHLWQGDDDWFLSVMLQRYIVSKLAWIRYHEIAGSGHFFSLLDGNVDKIVKTLLVGG